MLAQARMPPLGSFIQSPSDARRPTPSAASTKKGQKRAAVSSITGTSNIGNQPPSMPTSQPVNGSSLPPKKKARAVTSAAGETSGVQGLVLDQQVYEGQMIDTIEELEWIDRCKRVIGNKTVYNEFLKVLNLFSQEIIDAKTLVERIEPFLTRAPDLFEWFKRFVKYEKEHVIGTNLFLLTRTLF